MLSSIWRADLRCNSATPRTETPVRCLIQRPRLLPSRTERDDSGGNKRRELADKRQGSLGSLGLGVPAAITSEAQGAAAVEDSVVEKVPSCGSLCASTEAITTRSRSSKGNPAKSCGAGGPYSGAPLDGDCPVDRVPECGSVSGVETRHRRQRGSGVEVDQVPASNVGRLMVASGYRTTQARGRAGQHLMIKLTHELPTKIEIL